MTPVQGQELDSFLAGKRNAVVATIRKDGQPQLTPVSFHWDGALLRFSTTKGRAKFRNLQRDPRITVCIDEAQPSPRYLTIYGRVEMTDQPEEVLEGIRAIRRKYRGDMAADALTAEELQAEGRVLITVRPERMVS